MTVGSVVGTAQRELAHTPRSAELETPAALLPDTTPRPWRSITVRILLPAVLVVTWCVGSASGLFAPYVLPSPWKIVMTFGNLFRTADLAEQIGISLERAALGLLIGAAIGLDLGVASGLWRLGEELVDAVLQMLKTLPFLALVPLFVVWFGIGEMPKVTLIALAAISPTYLNTYSGVRNVDRRYIEAGRAFGLRGRSLVREVVLPIASPQILSGIRYSMAISILALVAAEQINAQRGIGYLLNQAEANQEVNVLIACVVLYCALGLLADLVVRIIEHFALPWRSSVAAR